MFSVRTFFSVVGDRVIEAVTGLRDINPSIPWVGNRSVIGEKLLPLFVEFSCVTF